MGGSAEDPPCSYVPSATTIHDLGIMDYSSDRKSHSSPSMESISYGTHSMRRTKATQIYRKTGNLRAVQLLLGHTKLESTVRYLGIEVDDALQIAEQIEL